MDEEHLAELADQQKDPEPTDVFLWANNVVPIIEELKIDLFLFNKNQVVYRPVISKDLQAQLQELIIEGLVENVLSGAAEGMTVRAFEEGESEENVLQKTSMDNVHKAKELLAWLRTQEAEIETFNEAEHDIKRLKGLVARCTHPDFPWPFYVIKALPGSSLVKGTKSWMIRGGKFVPYDAEGSMQIPGDNQLLVLGDEMYVFNQTRLEQLFGYNAKKYGIAAKKMAEIQANFNFHFDTGLSWENLVAGQKTLVNKLQKVDVSGVNQEELMKHAEELGIDLMIDDNGAIIIMDAKDLAKFINLLNDDYIESPLTGKRYEIKSKKPLKIAEPDAEASVI